MSDMARIWNEHNNQLGDWCPWSGLEVSGKDKRCPAGCPTSRVATGKPRVEVKPLWTVIGVWVNDAAVPLGVIEGRHAVHVNFDLEEIEDQQGPWAVSVSAPDAKAAEQRAVEEMLGTLDRSGP
jgi:hypothetical protein